MQLKLIFSFLDLDMDYVSPPLSLSLSLRGSVDLPRICARQMINYVPKIRQLGFTDLVFCSTKGISLVYNIALEAENPTGKKKFRMWRAEKTKKEQGCTQSLLISAY